MKYYSTNGHHTVGSFKEAMLTGLASDNGLFMPERIPLLPDKFVEELQNKSLHEIALEVAKHFLEDEIPERDLKQIIEDSLSFKIPIVPVENDIYSLELFHGPTLAFKDVAARFMARLMAYFTKDKNSDVTILVATSGDTGSAVANGFLGVQGIKVVLLYPSGKVSEIQEKQLTTLGQNVTALEVNGTFDDCQKMVKEAFWDKELNQKLTLTSANSINIARLIPQSFYYFYAVAQLGDYSGDIYVSVPSGNFGNLTAGLMAKRMGVPITGFIAGTNANDVVPEYLSKNIFSPRPSVATISNAMDVGNPSNFVRMLELYEHDHDKMALDVHGFSYTDEETRSTMKDVYDRTGYILDPHGAIGYRSLKKFLTNKSGKGIFFETAHPAKFLDIVEDTLGIKIEVPESLWECIKKEKKSLNIENSAAALKGFLLSYK